MKKLWLISAMSLGLVLFAGCSQVSTPVTINNSQDVIDLYNEANTITCVMNYDSNDEQWVSNIYIDKWMIRQDTTSTVWDDVLSMHTLARDGRMYVWWDLYWDDMWYSVSYDLDIIWELSAFDEMDEYTSMTCTKGVKDDSVFVLPNNLEFTSMDDFLNEDEYYWDEEVLGLEWEVEEVVEEVNEEVNE